MAPVANPGHRPESVQTPVPHPGGGPPISHPAPIRITDVQDSDLERIPTGFHSFDRVLGTDKHGAGLVVGSVLLLSGDPGCGKTTILTQMLAQISRALGRRILYASGEESEEQVTMRARRVGAEHDQFWIVSDNDVDRVIAHAGALEPAILAVDSIQTLSSDDFGGVRGSISQIKGCTGRLAEFAKRTGIPTIIVGHVTKDGDTAGPKTLEHLVDVTLQIDLGEFEGGRFRYLRAHKNRFGSTQEIGAFEMTGDGMIDADEEAAREADRDSAFEIGLLAQELLDRYQIQGGTIDDGMRDRIAGRLDVDAWRNKV